MAGTATEGRVAVRNTVHKAVPSCPRVPLRAPIVALPCGRRPPPPSPTCWAGTVWQQMQPAAPPPHPRAHAPSCDTSAQRARGGSRDDRPPGAGGKGRTPGRSGSGGRHGGDRTGRRDRLRRPDNRATPGEGHAPRNSTIRGRRKKVCARGRGRSTLLNEGAGVWGGLGKGLS